MIAMNNKEKIYTIVFIPPIWQDKNNNYTQMLGGILKKIQNSKKGLYLCKVINRSIENERFK
jgi:hypothetical protein